MGGPARVPSERRAGSRTMGMLKGFLWMVFAIAMVSVAMYATDDFELAHRLAPGNSQVHYNLAITLQQLGNPEQARASFDRASTLDPRWVAPRRELILLHAKTLRDPTRLRELCRELAGRAPPVPIPAACQ